jgi:hypothetical protein
MYENGKMRPVETIPGIEGDEGEEEWWRGWIQLWHIVRTLENVVMYSHRTIIEKRKKKKAKIFSFFSKNALTQMIFLIKH